MKRLTLLLLATLTLTACPEGGSSPTTPSAGGRSGEIIHTSPTPAPSPSPIP